MKSVQKRGISSVEDTETIHELVGLLYEAAVDERVWPEFLRRLSYATSPSFASFVTREFGVGNTSRGFILLRRIPEENSGFEAIYAVLGKHLRRALELQCRMQDLENQQVNLQASLNRISIGIVLLDERLLVRFANTSAKRILDQRSSLFLSHGMLSAQNRKEALHLNTALHQMVNGKATAAKRHQAISMWISRSCGRKAVGVTIHRAKPAGGIGEGPCSVAVYLNDPEFGILPATECMAQLYGFTPAETSVACELLQGRNLEECAKHLSISLNTAKTHLRRVLEKTDTSRQSDLMRLLVSGPAALGV